MKIIIILFLLCLGGAYVSHANGEVSWGQPTNGISVGLLNSSSDYARKKAVFEIWLRSGTNALLPFIVPDRPSEFKIDLFDRERNPVTKTSAGKQLGTQISAVTNIQMTIEGPKKRPNRIFLSPQQPEILREGFNLFDYFQINKPGQYTVEFEQRLQIPLNHDTLRLLEMPKVVFNLEIK